MPTCSGRNSTGRPLTMPTIPSRAVRSRERVEGAGQGDGGGGVVDDRSKGAVEVDDQRRVGAGRRRAERVRRVEL